MTPELFDGGRVALRPRIALVILLSLGAAENCMAETTIHALPQPGLETNGCLESILRDRRTTRSYASRPLSLADAAKLLWAAQGITSDTGYRTAPSAGALYPLELHLVAGDVEGLPAGVYHYDPVRHRLQHRLAGDLRQAIAAAAFNQQWIAQAPAIVVVSAVDSRTTEKYGPRGIRYVHMEVGHASQNLLLEAVEMGLAGAIVGAFEDERVKNLLQLPGEERPLAILAVGHAR